MDSISPAWLLLAVLICSMIGRFLLIRAAWEISKGWGFAVLCVPFAPMVFRMKYKELAGEGQHWRTATTVFAVAFFAVTGSSGSLGELWDLVPQKWRPAEYADHREPEVSEPDMAPMVKEPEERDEKTSAVAAAPSTGPVLPVAPAQAAPAPAKLGFMARIAAIVSPAAAQVAPPASLAPAPAPKPAPATGGLQIAILTPPLAVPLTLSQRVAANQAEFARLGAVYEALKKEKGYLKKWDQEAIKAYNVEAATYQAALAAARAEQVEISKQASVAKK